MISLSLIPFFFFFKQYFYETPAPLSVPQISIGFVNLSVIRNEGLVFKSFKDLLDEHYKNYHSELLTEEENLRKNYNEIKRLESAGKKTTTELQTQRSALDQKVVELEKKIRDKREKLNARLAIIKDEIEETIQKIIIDVSEERHLNLVFNATVMDARVLLYGDKEFDITPEVLEKLDNQLPKVHL
jgi:outer membrane protein